jgi:hypothetical protein
MSDNSFSLVKKCRVCNSSDFFNFLDLGATPHADQFLTTKELLEPEIHYPLTVRVRFLERSLRIEDRMLLQKDSCWK